MKNLIRLFCGLLVASIGYVTIGCTNQNINSIADSKMEDIIQQRKAVGLTVAVVKDGQIIYNESFGFKSLEDSTLLENDHIFRIASISKSFTTTALMTLIEQDMLSLDTDVSELVGFTVRNPQYPQEVITVKMLLSHTSSINDSQGYFVLDVLNPQINSDYGKCYNNYAPGTEYEYCNLGFNTIGAIIERVSNERFDEYIKRVVLDPLELNANFNVNSLDNEKFVNLYAYTVEEGDSVKKFIHRPDAYLSRAEEISNNYILGYSTPIFSPTGGMKISSTDLAKYMIMHMNYGYSPMLQKRVISEESAKKMQEPIAKMSEGNFYGLALRESKTLIPGETMIGHTGSAYGLYSAMFFEPTKGFGIVMITNGCDGEYEDGFLKIQRDVIRELYNVFIK
jgi:CubicO group peptidase (beta-lactamase class C family)